MVRRVVLACFLTLLVAAPARAQSSRWYEPYEKGLEAYKAGKWQDAIDNFNTAIGAEPKQQATKNYEGVHFIDYFPYYYLGVAYLKLGNIEKADLNFDKAQKSGRMPNDLVADTKTQRAQIASLKSKPAAAPAAAQPPPAPAVAPGAPPAAQPTAPAVSSPPPQPAVDPRFTSALNLAEASLNDNKTAEALSRFDNLKTQFPTEYAKANVAARRDAAVAKRATEVANEGQRLLNDGKLKAALDKFLEADRLQATPLSTKGQQDISTRRKDYDKAHSSAVTNNRNGKFAEAIQDYQDAKKADPEKFSSDGLDENLRQAQQKLAAQPKPSASPVNAPNPVAPPPVEAPPPPQPAVSAPPAAAPNTGTAAKTAAAPPATAPASVPAPGAHTAPPVRAALLAYLQGNVQQTIDLLQPSAGDGTLDAHGKAEVHAYLAVAYANRSLVSTKEEDRRQFSQKATDAFRVALEAEPGYRLSERLVSPKIQDLLNAARPKR